MRTEEDKKARGSRIGSGDVAAILGLSPFRKPIDVYMSCALGIEQEQTDALLIGELLEPAVLELYRRKVGAPTETPGLFVHPSLEFTCSTPDAVSWRAGTPAHRAVEAKTANGWAAEEWGEPGTDEVPSQYVPQCQWHLLHIRADYDSSAEVCDVPVLIGGFKFQIYEVRWDAKLASDLVDAARDFWTNHIVPRIPPPVDGSASYTDFLRSQWPANTSPLRPAPPEAAAIAAELREWRSGAKVCTEKLDFAKNQLRALIGAADGIQGEGWKATWKATKSKTRTLRVTFEGDDDE